MTEIAQPQSALSLLQRRFRPTSQETEPRRVPTKGDAPVGRANADTRNQTPLVPTVTIRRVGQLAGATNRALRHYEVLGLLRPTRIGHGVRRYTKEDCERAIAISRLRRLDVPLPVVREILDEANDDVRIAAFEAALFEQLERLEGLIPAVREALRDPKAWLAVDPHATQSGPPD